MNKPRQSRLASGQRGLQGGSIRAQERSAGCGQGQGGRPGRGRKAGKQAAWAWAKAGGSRRVSSPYEGARILPQGRQSSSSRALRTTQAAAAMQIPGPAWPGTESDLVEGSWPHGQRKNEEKGYIATVSERGENCQDLTTH